MKKVIRIVFCLMLGGLILTGCSNGSDPFEQKEYAAGAAQIGGVSINVRDRQIEVSRSEDDQIHIVYCF